MTADAGRHASWVLERQGEDANETYEVREPHPGAQAFSGDISYTQHQVDVSFKSSQEIAG
jgi:hypothetical protein